MDSTLVARGALMVATKQSRFSAHASILDADPANVIVTLFCDMLGTPRGSFRLPPKISADFRIEETVEERNLLAPIAILRAVQAAIDHGLDLSVVDPLRLWVF